ncbi:MAG: redoxin domain-containing protein [Nodularia sp. CChRGM 3473]
MIFYRGWFCPICHNYLAELERLLDDFTKLGVEAIAISGDSQAGSRKGY